ncbi:MAG: hemerythrin family protein [Geothrix sp.]|uniref:bacteriohemerythrin n=1 Tax=Geothrix sp. TaxID=1962974 RepID=UPI001814024F|nr:bacteriohemerythrin [Geothrix sp.]NWJ39397.1 hemerythrin family protein [Geothrix sp.]WIL19378.1 MAG: bacteriohemerythrin [Geothrix sp.]
MAFLSWHQRFSVGHAEIDQQHRRLFELVNHFDDVIQMGMPGELPHIVEDIISLGDAHFRFEEGVIQDTGFPRVAEHRKMHAELLDQIRVMQTRLMAGGHVSHKAVVRFLADWLTNHILREDMEYKPYLRT